MPYFVERTHSRRLLLALIGIAAAAAVFVGITGYLEPKREPTPLKDMSPPSVVRNNSVAKRKSTSAKTLRARIPAPDGDAFPAGLLSDRVESSFLGEESSSANVPTEASNDESPQPPRNEIKAARRSCVPLPNSTRPGDVDAIYYQNWANEYGCKLR